MAALRWRKFQPELALSCDIATPVKIFSVVKCAMPWVGGLPSRTWCTCLHFCKMYSKQADDATGRGRVVGLLWSISRLKSNRFFLRFVQVCFVLLHVQLRIAGYCSSNLVNFISKGSKAVVIPPRLIASFILSHFPNILRVNFFKGYF